MGILANWTNATATAMTIAAENAMAVRGMVTRTPALRILGKESITSCKTLSFREASSFLGYCRLTLGVL